MLSVITPTRNRTEAVRLLADCIDDFEEWIVVNDGVDFIALSHVSNSVELNRVPKVGEGHSLCENLLVGLATAKNDLIAIAEDDDFYSEGYFTELQAAFDDPAVELAGFAPAFYYHAPSRSWVCCGNGKGPDAHCSLGMTAFRRSLIPRVVELCKRGRPFIDVPLWRMTPPEKRKILSSRKDDGTLLHVGLKGLVGEKGIGMGHQPLREKDQDLKWLKAAIGAENADRYAAIAGPLN